MSLPENSTCLQAEVSCGTRDQDQMTIDRLPDDVLLVIFHFCRPLKLPGLSWFLFLPSWSRSWKMLIQVCRRWRYIVLGSPRRLDLRVLCTPTTPTRTLLDICWPPFPICICNPQFGPVVDEGNVDNLIAAVEHRGRTSQIYISDIYGSELERLIDAMHEPLPALTDFYLQSLDHPSSVIPATFLSGSAPNLHSFTLFGIAFPSFPKFILSATRIVYLHLYHIPYSGYISPDKMATCLAALPNLKSLGFEFTQFRDRLSIPPPVDSPPLSRPVLPALATLLFKGTSEYFEHLLSRTHIPLLKLLHIQFFTHSIFDIPRTHNLIDRVEAFRLLTHAWVMFNGEKMVIKLGLPTRIWLEFEILFWRQNWQLSSLVHVFCQHLPLSSVEQLSICELSPNHYGFTRWDDDLDPSRWLEVFHLFIAVRNLYVAKILVPFGTAALQQLTGERTMEVFPALTDLSLEGFGPPEPVQEAIKPFVSARQLSNHPIVIHSNPPPQAPPFSPRAM